MLSTFLASLLVTAPIQPDVLILLEHAGETKDLLLVVNQLKKSETNIKIIALGTAKTLVDPKIYENELYPLTEPISLENIEKITKEITPKLFLTGVATEQQRKFLEAFGKTSTKTFAYWDNPDPNGSSPYFSQALKTAQAAQYLLVPSTYVANAPEFNDRDPSTLLVVGKPTLEEFQKTVQALNPNEILSRIPSFQKNSPILAFAGTYGKEYEKAFALLIDCINQTSWQGEKKQVIFQIHPSSSGEFEKSYVKENLDPNVTYLISQKGEDLALSIEEAISVSSLFVSYNSSSNYQASVCGKKVANVIPADDLYSSSLLRLHISTKITSPKDLTTALESNQTYEKDTLYREMGMPKNSIEQFTNILQQELNQK